MPCTPTRPSPLRPSPNCAKFVVSIPNTLTHTYPPTPSSLLRPCCHHQVIFPSSTPLDPHDKDYTDICPHNLLSISPPTVWGLVRFKYVPIPPSYPPAAAISSSTSEPYTTVSNISPLDKDKSDNTAKPSCT